MHEIELSGYSIRSIQRAETSSETQQILEFIITTSRQWCACEQESVLSTEISTRFGREKVKKMLSTYTACLAREAANPDHSLNRYAKEQLAMLWEFVVQYRYKRSDILDQAMKMEDYQDLTGQTLLGPKLKKLLNVSDQIFVPERKVITADGTFEIGTTLKSCSPDNPNYYARPASKRDIPPQAPQLLKSNPSHMRKLRAIFDFDKETYEKVKSKGIRGMSMNPRKPKKPKVRPDQKLGIDIDEHLLGKRSKKTTPSDMDAPEIHQREK